MATPTANLLLLELKRGRVLNPSWPIGITGLVLLGTLTAGMFWVIGGLATLPVLDYGLFSLIIGGLIIGGAGTTSYRSNGLWWVNKNSWLWLRFLPVIILALLVTAITILPYHAGQAESRSILSWFVTDVSLLLLGQAAFLIGLVVGLIGRRITPNPFIRTTWLVMAIYGFGWLIFSTNWSTVIEQALLRSSVNSSVTVLLLTFALTAVAIIGTQLIVEVTPVTATPIRQFWPALNRVRLIGPALSPFSAEVVAALRYYYRSAAVQRRLAVALIIAGVLVIVSNAPISPWFILGAEVVSLWVATAAFCRRPKVNQTVATVVFGLVAALLLYLFTLRPIWLVGLSVILVVLVSAYHSQVDKNK